MSGDESAATAPPQQPAAAAAAAAVSDAAVSRSEELKAEANELFKREKYVDSIEKYSEAIELNSSNAVLFANRYLQKEGVQISKSSISFDPRINSTPAYGHGTRYMVNLGKLG